MHTNFPNGVLHYIVYKMPMSCWRVGVLDEVLDDTSNRPGIEKLRSRLDLVTYPGTDKIYYDHVVTCKKGCHEKYISIFKEYLT